MTMTAFEPVGEQARWRTLYYLIRDVAVGDLLSYEEMATALDLDPLKDRNIIQLAMRRAGRELETTNKRAVDAVPNQGYRVVEPEEHALLARRHQRKSNRSLVRGHSKVVNVDFNQMDPEARKAIELMASAFASQMDFNRRMDVRQANLEKAVEAVTRQTEAQANRTDEELAALHDRLRRVEERTSKSA